MHIKFSIVNIIADNAKVSICCSVDYGYSLTHFYLCSFLCLVPDEAKSSYHVEGTGYDTYLRDAHRQVSQWSLRYSWRICGGYADIQMLL